MSFYVIDLIKNYINRLILHENIVLKEIIASQRDYSWTNTNYLSPFGLQNENIVYDLANSSPDFFKKTYPDTHRG